MTKAPAKKHKPISAKQRAAFLKNLKQHPHKPGTKPRHSKGAHHHQKGTAHRRQPAAKKLALNGGHEGDAVQFGRTAPYARHEKPRLVIDHYFDTAVLPPAPAVVDRSSAVVEWPMYVNGPDPSNPPSVPDGCGDCTIACAGHEIQAWNALGNYSDVRITDQDVLAAYEAVSGFNPATGENDNGANVQDVLTYWRKHGIGGHKIGGFAQLSGVDNTHLVRHALDLFGSVYLGIQVPQSAMDQFEAGQPWHNVGDDNIVGGHAVPIQWFGQPGVSAPGIIHVVTWGQIQHMTYDFYFNYTDEAWVIFSPDWLNKISQKSVEGFDLAQLKADFELLTGEPLS